MAIREEELTQMATFLRVLADKNRLRIVGLLSAREYTVRELATEIDLTEPTVSHHLNWLKSAGIVEMRPEGTSHHYSLRQDDIFRLLRELKEAAHSVPEEFGEDENERKLLRAYFEFGRLKEIPPHHNNKRMIVLKRLVVEFHVGQRYTEKQVNEILKRFHPDCATLRRLLVDNQMLQRENSIYWRPENPGNPENTGEEAK